VNHCKGYSRQTGFEIAKFDPTVGFDEVRKRATMIARTTILDEDYPRSLKRRGKLPVNPSRSESLRLGERAKLA
jgi:hypothetical protein